ncbi:MAG TPA: ESX secretion-associated protein EspG [Pseudonocardiaceae bacterium]|nr:ESX secretion-associated protein EspG [Pseudonocardiaceae bacterium]
MPSSVVLSALEFDVLWAGQRFPRRHVALDVPSPGATHSERAKLEAQAWAGLGERGLAKGTRADSELADQLAILANPKQAVDVWVWTDREIRALAASAGNNALLAVVDGGQVWLIPARPSSFVQAAVSVAGECPAGGGRSVSLPLETLRAAEREVGGDTTAIITALSSRGVALPDAQELAGMFTNIEARGQFGAELTLRDGRIRRADRVVAFHDTDWGRYLYLARSEGGRAPWVTVTPANNARIVENVADLLEEL